MADRKALDVAREEHARIYDAIAAGDVDLARAATLLHISDNEAWLREHLGPAEDVPLNGD
jgi:GntR family transcriptional repressor for pyruvate dehydrogenase complex